MTTTQFYYSDNIPDTNQTPFIISGPPSVGKSSIQEYLIKNCDCEQISLVLSAQLTLSQTHSIKYRINEILQKDKTPINHLPTQLIPQFMQIYPHTQAIFLLPYSIELLEQRMKQKGQTEKTIENNLNTGLEEIVYYNDYVKQFYSECYIVEQNNFDQIIQSIQNRFFKDSLTNNQQTTYKQIKPEI